MTEQHSLPGRVDAYYMANVASTDAEAFERARRWNAFEPGGAVAGAIEAMQMAIWMAREHTADDAVDGLHAALDALVEPGAGAGKEPQR